MTLYLERKAFNPSRWRAVERPNSNWCVWTALHVVPFAHVFAIYSSRTWLVHQCRFHLQLHQAHSRSNSSLVHSSTLLLKSTSLTSSFRNPNPLLNTLTKLRSIPYPPSIIHSVKNRSFLHVSSLGFPHCSSLHLGFPFLVS